MRVEKITRLKKAVKKRKQQKSRESEHLLESVRTPGDPVGCDGVGVHCRDVISLPRDVVGTAGGSVGDVVLARDDI